MSESPKEKRISGRRTKGKREDAPTDAGRPSSVQNPNKEAERNDATADEREFAGQLLVRQVGDDDRQGQDESSRDLGRGRKKKT